MRRQSHHQGQRSGESEAHGNPPGGSGLTSVMVRRSHLTCIICRGPNQDDTWRGCDVDEGGVVVLGVGGGRGGRGARLAHPAPGRHVARGGAGQGRQGAGQLQQVLGSLRLLLGPHNILRGWHI